MTRVAVVGGGITGLAAARQLAAGGLEVTVFEAGSRWGGKLTPVAVDGVVLDGGAESFLIRRPEPLELVESLRLGARLTYPTAAKPRLLIDGDARPLPPSLLGVPTQLEPLRDILSAEGFARAVAASDRPVGARLNKTIARQPKRPEIGPFPASGDGIVEFPRSTETDVAIGELVDRHFGPEVTDRLLDPLLGGVYAGDARKLSFAAVAPELFARAGSGGSLLELAAAAVRTPAAGPVFAGLVGGINQVVDALLADLVSRGVRLRSGTPVTGLDAGLRLTVGPASAPEHFDVDGVVIAAPARTLDRLLSPLASGLATTAYASVAVVTLIVRGLAAEGSGLLVPRGGLPTIKALTYSSQKWSWVAERAAAAWGEDVSVVRASIGRIGEDALLQVGDGALISRTWQEARDRIPGWSGGELVAGEVTRWGGALPQYAVGHLDRVAELRRRLPRRVAIAGAALDGVGLAACLGSAAAAAAKITAEL